MANIKLNWLLNYNLKIEPLKKYRRYCLMIKMFGLIFWLPVSRYYDLRILVNKEYN